MGFLNSIKKTLDKETVANMTNKVKEAAGKVMQGKEAEETEEEKGSKMVQVMDWAFDKANGNIPGFGTSAEMSKKYLDKNEGSVTKSIDELVKWQITAAATAGFVTSLGGLATMPFTLPANVAGVMAIQLRMIGAIALMGGADLKDEDTKTGMYLCMLGAQAGNVISKTAGQFAVKFATASLKKLPGEVLKKINQAVGFRLVTKFGNKGLVNVNRAIPILGGVVGGAVDAFSTFAIAKAAKALFLNDIIDFEKQELIEIAKVRLVINMALVDGVYSPEECDVLKCLVLGLNISDKAKEMLAKEIDNPRRQQVDLAPFKEDMMNSASLLAGLSQLAKADGTIHVSEQIYINSLGKELGFDEATLKQIMG